MPDLTPDSAILQDCLDRWRSGDQAAAGDLLKMIIARLQKLSRRMLRSFPNVRGIADTDDVLQNSLLRLFRTLQRIKPTTTRDFFNLAAVHIRRELLDLARSNRRKSTVPLDSAWNGKSESGEPLAPETSDADRWVQFHKAVDRLPLEEREVVGLIFYHGWTQRRIAELFGVDERTIRRRWAAACARLKKMIGKDFLEE
jgi:RNA polymerase sigma-70 factor (ECF subfamily)